MKPPPFDYIAPGTLEEAISALAAEEDAKVIAGGQSLMPLLALRLARPTLLVDIGDVGLDHLVIDPPGPGARVRIGALVRQRRLETDPALGTAVPLLADAAGQVGYLATRNRGTLGGSLAHADPVAELPAVVVALGGIVVASGPGGSREILSAKLAGGFFTTTLAPDEVITDVLLPVASERHGAAWCEWSPRDHDFALAGVGVALDVDLYGACVAVQAAGCGTSDRPVSLGSVIAEAGVLGATRPEPALLDAVAARVEAASSDEDGEGGDAADGADRAGRAERAERAELAGLLAAMAVRRAFRRAHPSAGEVP